MANTPRWAPRYKSIPHQTIKHPNTIPTWNRTPPRNTSRCDGCDDDDDDDDEESSSSSLEVFEFEFDDDTKYFSKIPRPLFPVKPPSIAMQITGNKSHQDWERKKKTT